jgi:hypothetical protein
LGLNQSFGIRLGIGHRNFNQDMLAGAHALLSLPRVDLGRARQNHRLEARLFQRLAEIRRPVRDLPLPGHLFSSSRPPTGERDDFDVRTVANSLQMPGPKGALPRERDLHLLSTFGTQDKEDAQGWG